MGLTIHYQLQADTRSPKQARLLVDRLRQKALDLPFRRVSEVIDLGAEDIDRLGADSPFRWLLIQAEASVQHGDNYYRVKPKRVIAFSAWPGEGSEEANIGLAVYPTTLQVEDRSRWPHRTRRLRTGLGDWSWSSFVKTQYASDPRFGGVEHFLRCHLAVVKLLDHAADLGILQEVHDEAGYWQQRDVQALATEVGGWNTMLAGWAGRLKDLFLEGVVSEITKYPTFEQLEAKGRAGE